MIRVDGGRIDLGLFADEVDAARAYDAAAIEHHGGEFAQLNFPIETAQKVAQTNLQADPPAT